MGIRMHLVHFEQIPNIATIKNSLLALTGLALIFDEEFVDWLKIQHPTRPKSMVEMDWVDKENCKCIRVSSETPNWNYIQVSVLYQLNQLGGKPEDEFKLPSWAGKKWAEAYPRDSVLKLKAWWKAELPR